MGICGAVGLLALTLFVLRSRRSAKPLLPLSLWRHAGFRSASWVALTLGLGLYGSTYLIPLYLQTVEGYSAGRAGLLLLPAGAFMGLASFAGGWLSDRLSTALLLISGLLIFALSAAGLAWIGEGAAFLILCFWTCLGRVGLGLLLLGDVERDHRGGALARGRGRGGHRLLGGPPRHGGLAAHV